MTDVIFGVFVICAILLYVRHGWRDIDAERSKVRDRVCAAKKQAAERQGRFQAVD